MFPEIAGPQHLTVKTSPIWGQVLVATLSQSGRARALDLGRG